MEDSTAGDSTLMICYFVTHKRCRTLPSDAETDAADADPPKEPVVVTLSFTLVFDGETVALWLQKRQLMVTIVPF